MKNQVSYQHINRSHTIVGGLSPTSFMDGIIPVKVIGFMISTAVGCEGPNGVLHKHIMQYCWQQ
jgi:hypothetical protein